jgi:hypothetical protein
LVAAAAVSVVFLVAIFLVALFLVALALPHAQGGDSPAHGTGWGAALSDDEPGLIDATLPDTAPLFVALIVVALVAMFVVAPPPFAVSTRARLRAPPVPLVH